MDRNLESRILWVLVVMVALVFGACSEREKSKSIEYSREIEVAEQAANYDTFLVPETVQEWVRNLDAGDGSIEMLHWLGSNLKTYPLNETVCASIILEAESFNVRGRALVKFIVEGHHLKRIELSGESGCSRELLDYIHDSIERNLPIPLPKNLGGTTALLSYPGAQ